MSVIHIPTMKRTVKLTGQIFCRTTVLLFGADFRMEWKPDSATQIIFQPSFSYSNSHNREFGSFNTLTNLGDTVNLGESDYVSDGEGYNLNARLEFSRKLNDEGRVFSGSLTGGLSDSYNKGLNYSNTEYFMGNNQDELIDQQFRYDNKGFKLDMLKIVNGFTSTKELRDRILSCSGDTDRLLSVLGKDWGIYKEDFISIVLSKSLSGSPVYIEVFL